MIDTRTRPGAVALALAALALCGSTALAAPPNAGRAALLDRLAACRKLAPDAQRLACYDAAAAALDQAEAKGDIVVVDREQARKVTRQAFGFTMPSLDLFNRGEAPEQTDAVTLKIESARRMGDGKWLLRLEGGQVWRQIDTDDIGHDLRAGATVTIKRAMLGSYKLTSGGGGAIRVHRDD